MPQVKCGAERTITLDLGFSGPSGREVTIAAVNGQPTHQILGTHTIDEATSGIRACYRCEGNGSRSCDLNENTVDTSISI